MLRFLPLLPPVSFILLLFVVFTLLYIALPRRRKLVLNMKHVVITGGSKGIGRELAFCCVRKGCNISIIARNEDDLKKTHHDLQAAADRRGQQQKVHWYSLDLSKNYSEIEAVFDRIEHELGPIHILINNAGTIVQGAFDDIPVSVFEDQMALNFYTAVYPTRCVVPRMKGRGFGHISFVSSAAGQFAIWGYSSYSASKFALRGLADAVQMELLPYNISVSVLCPPNTETDVFKTGDHLVSHALEIATYLGPSRHDNPSKVHQQAQKRRKLSKWLKFGAGRWIAPSCAGCPPRLQRWQAILSVSDR